MYLNTIGHLFSVQKNTGKCVVAFYQGKPNQKARAISTSLNGLPRVAGADEA